MAACRGPAFADPIFPAATGAFQAIAPNPDDITEPGLRSNSCSRRMLRRKGHDSVRQFAWSSGLTDGVRIPMNIELSVSAHQWPALALRALQLCMLAFVCFGAFARQGYTQSSLQWPPRGRLERTKATLASSAGRQPCPVADRSCPTHGQAFDF